MGFAWIYFLKVVLYPKQDLNFDCVAQTQSKKKEEK